ncbi:MAG: hypothetical protein ACHQFW_05365 [Chitinophagales bacterium]
MIAEPRKIYNSNFTEEKYNNFFEACQERFDQRIEFKVCETPVFIPAEFRNKLMQAGDEILDIVCHPDFIERSVHAIPKDLIVPGNEGKPVFIALDFGICESETGELIPQLIEMQGFASLYGWQHELGKQYRNYFEIPENVSHLFNGLNNETYVDLLKKIIVGEHDPKQVIILELEPDKQKTWVDFYITREMVGIEPVCISKIIVEGKNLFYMKNGSRIQIKRIYNRLIFDELLSRNDLQRQWNLTEEANVEWVCHPNWFFRISKYTLPFIKSAFVPETYFLNELKTIPPDLENWVLKPLYSFAGHGVVFNVKKQDIDNAMPQGGNFILQRKVKYKPVIKTLDDPAKCELRLMYLWENNKPRPTLVINLTRLSKGEMIGVDYNKNKSWVGGTVGYFEV